jgi:hypothetical protein
MIILLILILSLAIVQAAHPTGTFTLSNFKQNTTTTSLRECDGQLYSTPSVHGNKDFDFNLVNALNGDRNSVSFQSNKNSSMYIQVSTYPRLGVNVYNKLDTNAVSFKVVGGLNRPTDFSFKASTGEFIALTHSLDGDCAKQYQAPASDVALVNFSDLKSKADATWRLMIPTQG